MERVMVISLNQFMAFVLERETQRSRRVKKIMNGDLYSPVKDYWKKAREAIQKFLKGDAIDKGILKGVFRKLNSKKVVNYKSAVNGLEKYLRGKVVKWYRPPVHVWTCGELSIKVRFDAGLYIGGDVYFVKLYFNKKRIAFERLRAIFQLMEADLDPVPPARVGIFDVRNSRMLTMDEPDMFQKNLLNEEADAFIEIWNGLKRKKEGGEAA